MKRTPPFRVLLAATFLIPLAAFAQQGAGTGTGGAATTGTTTPNGRPGSTDASADGVRPAAPGIPSGMPTPGLNTNVTPAQQNGGAGTGSAGRTLAPNDRPGSTDASADGVRPAAPGIPSGVPTPGLNANVSPEVTPIATPGMTPALTPAPLPTATPPYITPGATPGTSPSVTPMPN